MAKNKRGRGPLDPGRREFVKKSAQGILAASLSGAVASGCASLAGKSMRALASGGVEVSSNPDEFEYIVVGSGAGGGPVACNLARAGYRVLLLEAGTDYKSPNYDIPAFHPRSTEDPGMAWNFYVQHYADSKRQALDSKFIKDKGILYPRAGTLGGCTAHNALLTVYPDNEDWDGIARLTGDSSWNSSEMRKYFRRMERNRYIKKPAFVDPQKHGYDGWLSTEQTDPKLLLKDPKLLKIVLGAVAHEGLHPEIFENLKLDPNAWKYVQNKTNGIFNIPKATDNGGRNGTREFILRTLSEFPDRLVLRSGCLATRVLFDDVDRTRVVGVEYLEGEHLYRADLLADQSPVSLAPSDRPIKRAIARREVILSGGAFNSPQLLQLSGIGDPSDLSIAGVDTRVELPGVGRNLQDRYEIAVVTELDGDLSSLKNVGFGAPGDSEMRAYQSNPLKSLYSSNGTLVAFFKRSSRRVGDPDLCIFALAGSFKGYYPGYSADVLRKDRITWAVLKGHTRNTAGTVRVRTPDPRDPPEICFRYFDEGNDVSGRDLEDVLDGLKWVRGMNRGLLERLVTKNELVPGRNVSTDDQLRQFVKNEAWGHHASCSNRMGRADDRMAVVDSKFRVRGTKGLRVVDASVFPKIPGLFIVVPVYMVAEKASEDIIADAFRGS